ncbi:hypothetical protein CC79DRAFT_1111651 [Sarocladium strictum]
MLTALSLNKILWYSLHYCVARVGLPEALALRDTVSASGNSALSQCRHSHSPRRHSRSSRPRGKGRNKHPSSGDDELRSQHDSHCRKVLLDRSIYTKWTGQTRVFIGRSIRAICLAVIRPTLAGTLPKGPLPRPRREHHDVTTTLQFRQTILM